MVMMDENSLSAKLAEAVQAGQAMRTSLEITIDTPALASNASQDEIAAASERFSRERRQIFGKAAVLESSVMQAGSVEEAIANCDRVLNESPADSVEHFEAHAMKASLEL